MRLILYNSSCTPAPVIYNSQNTSTTLASHSCAPRTILDEVSPPRLRGSRTSLGPWQAGGTCLGTLFLVPAQPEAVSRDRSSPGIPSPSLSPVYIFPMSGTEYLRPNQFRSEFMT